MPEVLYYNDGSGNLRKVPKDKQELFQKHFPKATQATEEELSSRESQIADRNEASKSVQPIEPVTYNPDKLFVRKEAGSDIGKPSDFADASARALASHKQDPDIDFRAKYGAYRDNPELHRIEGQTGLADFVETSRSKKHIKDNKNEAMSMQDFLQNTSIGRQTVEYDKNENEYFMQLDKQISDDLAKLKAEWSEKAKQRDALIKRGVPGTRYGVKRSWLTDEEKAKIDSQKSEDIKAAQSIATAREIEDAQKYIQMLEDMQSRVADRDKSGVRQLFGELKRGIPETLLNIGTLGLVPLIEAIAPDNRPSGEMAHKAQEMYENFTLRHMDEQTMAQDIAQGTLHSLDFMAQFATARGVVSAGTKGLGRAILANGSKRAAKEAAKRGAKETAKHVALVAGKEVGQTLLQTTIMPATWADAIERNAENPGSFLDNFSQAFISNAIEVGSERVGEFIPVNIKFKNKRLAAIQDALRPVMTATGIQGAIPELIEEQVGTIGHALFKTGEEDWADLIDPRNQLVTAGTIGLMQVPYAGIYAGGYSAGKVRNMQQKRSINKGFKVNVRNMHKTFGQEAEELIGVINESLSNAQTQHESAIRLFESLSGMQDLNQSEQDAIAKYGLSFIAKKGLDQAKEEKKQIAMQRAKDIVGIRINEPTGTVIMAKVPNLENPVNIEGEVHFDKNGNIDREKTQEVYYTDADGRKKPIHVDFIEIIENNNAKEVEEAIYRSLNSEIENEEATDSLPEYKEGDQVISNLFGQPMPFIVQKVDESGNITATHTLTGETIMFPPQTIIDNTHLSGIENGVEIEYKSQTGETATGVVDDASLIGNGILIVDGVEVDTDNVYGLADQTTAETESQTETEESTKTSEIEAENENPSPSGESNSLDSSDITTDEAVTDPDQQYEREKSEFMQSLPLHESGKRAGQPDQAKMTTAQTIQYFEYQFGEEKALRASKQQVEAIKKQLERESKKLENDPMNIELNEKVEAIQSQLEEYEAYVLSKHNARTETRIAETARTSAEQAERKAIQAQAEADAALQAQLDEEAVKGVPDLSVDKASDARNRGFRVQNGVKIDRQPVLSVERYKETERKFSTREKDAVPVKRTLVDSRSLQPSHKNGVRNASYFITETQPKERTDKASIEAKDRIASNINPMEITGGTTAYTGAPIANQHGEIIQGNGRTNALQTMYESHSDQAAKYKQHLTETAHEYGMTSEEVMAMERPVAVDIATVEDGEAIRLGQLNAGDTESGGKQRIAAQQTAVGLGDKIGNFASNLFHSANDEASISEVMDQTGRRALDYLHKLGLINNTQYESAFDEKGNITPEAKKDLQDVAAFVLFNGANDNIKQMFVSLPDKARKSILQTIHRDADSHRDNQIVHEIRSAIEAYNLLMQHPDFVGSTDYADLRIIAGQAKNQTQMFNSETALPLQKYSNFAIEMAILFRSDTQKGLRQRFNSLYDNLQGKGGDIFNESVQLPLNEAIKKNFNNIDYVSNREQIQRADVGTDSAGRTGREQSRTGEAGIGKQGEAGERTSDRGRRVTDAFAESAKRAEKITDLAKQFDSSESTDEKAAIAAKIITEIDKAYPSAAETLLAESVDEFINHFSGEAKETVQEVIGKGLSVPGVYYRGKVILNIADVSSADELAKTWLHEQMHGVNEKNGVDLAGLYHELGRAEIQGKIHPEDRKRSIEIQADEYVAYVAEGDVTIGNITDISISESVNEPTRRIITNNINRLKNEKSRKSSNQDVLQRGEAGRGTHVDIADSKTVQGVRGENETGDDSKTGIRQPALQGRQPGNVDIVEHARNVHAANQVSTAAKQADTNPTEAQKEAGNYKKGHVKIQGLDISIENPKGSERSGTDKTGRKWSQPMNHHYGYIKQTESRDGDHIDVFIGENPNSEKVFVVDQIDTGTGKFDEHKVMIGFDNIDQAREAYLSNYEKGWGGLGAITEASMQDFKEWAKKDGRKVKGYAEYRENKIDDLGVRFRKGAGIHTEMQSIKERAVSDGTFMKAPNGKPTNLNEQQWLQTRTEAFKEWFGDWGLKYRQVVPVEAEKGKFKSFRDARTWAENNIVGILSNEQTGGKGRIDISKEAVKKFFSEAATTKSDNAGVHKDVAAVIPEIIKNSIVGEIHPDFVKRDGERKPENGMVQGVQIHRLYGAAIIDNAIYRVKTTIKYFDDANTNNKAHSYEVIKIELLDESNSSGSPAGTALSVSPIEATKLLQGIEKSYEKGKYLLDDHSKVVDENGEPLVVYHGTPDGGFSEFSEIKKGTRTGHDASDVGFHFTSDIDYASTYSLEYLKDNYQNLIDIFGYVPDASKAPENATTYSVYLKIDNPKTLPDAKIDKNIIDNAKKGNNDGLFASIDKTNEYVVFHPNQIKSATDNVGTFDSENDDIRFRTIDESAMRQESALLSREEFIERYAGSSADFRDGHTAPGSMYIDETIEERIDSGDSFSLAEVAQGYHTQPDDYFGRMGARWYGYDDMEGMQSYRAIRGVMQKVEAQIKKDGKIKKMPNIKTYRAVPIDVDIDRLIQGDWVTFSKEYAIGHGEMRFGEGEYKLITENVPADQLWWDGNDINEWGFDDGANLTPEQAGQIWDEAQNIRFRTGADSGINNSNTNFKQDEKTRYYTDSQGREIPFKAFNPDGNRGRTNLVERKGSKDSKANDFALVERQFTEYNHLDFTAGTKIESLDDVAWLFRNLEDEAVEHAFAIYIMPDNSYVVQHLSTGGVAATVLDHKLVAGNAVSAKANRVAFVHNHPSGQLKASRADMDVLSKLQAGLEGTGIDVMDGVIINLRSGKYVRFNSQYSEAHEMMSEQRQEQNGVQVLSFSKQVLASNYNPDKIASSFDVAKLMSSKRFGLSDKTELIILNTTNHVLGKFVLPQGVQQYPKIVQLLTQYGGTSAILYGNKINERTVRDYGRKLNALGFNLLDVIEVKSENYKSLASEGLIRDESGEYAANSQKTARVINSTIEENINDLLEETGIRFRVSDTAADIAEKQGEHMTEELRKELNDKYNKFSTRFREAWEDSYISVKDFQETIKKGGTKISEHNDWYKQATHLPGKNDTHLEYFRKNYQKKISNSIHDILKAGKYNYRDIENYVFAKHGIERNDWFREKKISELENPTEKQIAEINETDYAGLTDLEKELEMTAQEYVDQFESNTSGDMVDSFWKNIKSATDYSLNRMFQSGLVNRSTYNELKSRYKNYVPLRGHDQTVAEDVYDYTPDMGTYFSDPIISAKGRKSRAESPFAYIGQMAHSTILRANKNTLNQTMLRLARADKSGLLGVRRTWYRNTGTIENPVWQIAEAPYSNDIAENQKLLEKWESEMQDLAEHGMAKKSGSKLDIGGLFIKPKQEAQHEIHVYENGIAHTVTINANPAVSQAITGANKFKNPDNIAMQVVGNVSRQMAANFTTRNPSFIATNFVRDYLFATTSIVAGESLSYQIAFQRGIPKAAAALNRHNRGQMDMTNKTDRYLYEFMMNGGRTGFSSIFELQRQAKALEREAKKGDKKTVVDHTKAIAGVIDATNEIVENMTRLAGYMASREAGRSVMQSVQDAKTLTVNFNQRGAGTSVAKNTFERVLFSAAGFIRPLYLFSNAAIQSASNLSKKAVKNPGRWSAIMAGYALSAFLAPTISYLLAGDEGRENYMKLGDWERQNNWCVMLPNGSFLKIPLPHEMRVFHRMGDNIYLAATGKRTTARAFIDVMYALSDLLPTDPLNAADASIAELAPDAVRPFAQMAANTNFMGTRIYNEWAHKNAPGYLKTTTNKRGEYYAPQFLVDASQWIDHKTGGDGVKKGAISPNPDIANHMMRGYFGGLYTLAEQSVGILQKTYQFSQDGELNLRVRETPLKSFYADKADLNIGSSGISEKYYEISKDVNEALRRNRRYFEQVQDGKLSIEQYNRKIQDLDLYKAHELNDKIKEIRKYESELKNMNSEDQKEAERYIYDLKKEVISLNNTNK